MKKIFFISSVFSAILFSSCATVYRPNMTATPLFTEAGQVNLEAAYSRDGINASAAMAVAPSIAVMTNGQFTLGTKRIVAFDQNPTNGNYGEVALGYFKKVSDVFIFETYTGMGIGKLSDEATIGNSHPLREEFKYNRFFLQPNIGFRINKNFDLAFTPRLAYVSGDYFGSNLFDLFEDGKKAAIKFISFEPTFSLAFGGQNLKGYLQAGINTPLSQSKTYNYTAIYSIYNMGIGVKYNFSFRTKK